MGLTFLEFQHGYHHQCRHLEVDHQNRSHMPGFHPEKEKKMHINNKINLHNYYILYNNQIHARALIGLIELTNICPICSGILLPNISPV